MVRAMTNNKVEDSATAKMVREQFSNAKNIIEHVLNDALRAGFIDVEKGQEFMDLFSHHSATTERYLFASNPRFETDKGIAAMAVLNMVTIALAAGSREPNLALEKLKNLRRSAAAKARAAKEPSSAIAATVLEEELQDWREQYPARSHWPANAIANKIKDAVNVRRNELRLKPITGNALAKQIRALEKRTAN